MSDNQETVDYIDLIKEDEPVVRSLTYRCSICLAWTTGLDTANPGDAVDAVAAVAIPDKRLPLFTLRCGHYYHEECCERMMKDDEGFIICPLCKELDLGKCPICWCCSTDAAIPAPERGRELLQLKCGHFYHESCINWVNGIDDGVFECKLCSDMCPSHMAPPSQVAPYRKRFFHVESYRRLSLTLLEDVHLEQSEFVVRAFVTHKGTVEEGPYPTYAQWFGFLIQHEEDIEKLHMICFCAGGAAAKWHGYLRKGEEHIFRGAAVGPKGSFRGEPEECDKCGVSLVFGLGADIKHVDECLIGSR